MTNTVYKSVLAPYIQGLLEQKSKVARMADGYVLLTKRLTSGAFQWSRNADEAREMSQDDYERLMGGYTVESQVK